MPFLDGISNFKIYLIEPIKQWFDQLYEVYGKFEEKVIYLNYAISEKSSKIKMVDQGVMSKIGEGNLTVDSKTWSDFIHENKINSIDILLLDCEGYEFNILKQIDYKKNAPKNIRYEYIYSQEKEKMDSFLKEKGYYISLDSTDPTYNKVAKLV
jgi:FkbM family methyltransferase